MESATRETSLDEETKKKDKKITERIIKKEDKKDVEDGAKSKETRKETAMPCRMSRGSLNFSYPADPSSLLFPYILSSNLSTSVYLEENEIDV